MVVGVLSDHNKSVVRLVWLRTANAKDGPLVDISCVVELCKIGDDIPLRRMLVRQTTLRAHRGIETKVIIPWMPERKP